MSARTRNGISMNYEPLSVMSTNKGLVIRKPIGAIVILQPILQKRRRCLTFLAAALFITTIALLNVLYVLAKNFVRVHNLHKPRLINGTERPAAVWPSGFFPPNTYGFHPVNDRGVYSFWNVCIEAVERPITREMDMFGGKLYFNETAKIIVYNSFYRDGIQRLHVAGSHNSAWNHWDVDFRRGHIPLTHEFRNTSAFFVSQTCPANLHHFWIDEFVPLYCVVERANRLHQGANNQVLYRRPTDLLGSDINECYNKTRFEDLLSTLYTDPFHNVFYEAPKNVCYSSAVFGAHPFVVNPRSIVNHVLANVAVRAAWNVTLSNRGVIQSSYFVTFIQRRTRRILNLRELMKTTLWLGYKRVRIIDFERHPVSEQMRYASTSCVMVGVQGAGLQWAIFMPPGCTLIEVAWPSQHWGFHFRNYVEPYDIQHHSLRAVNAKVNWAAYESHVRQGKPVPVDERVRLLNKPPQSPSLDNVWKYADAFVNKEHFSEIMSSIDPHPRTPTQQDILTSYPRTVIAN